MEKQPANPDLPETTTAKRIRAIARDLAKQHKPKGERIDVAVRRLGALAEDLDKGIEG